MYSITLDPGRDTPAVLKQYAEAFGAKRGWYFLTGKPEEIELLRRKLGSYDPNPVIDADRSQHSGLLTYGNETIGAWGATPALLKPNRIVDAVLAVLRPENGASTAGSP
jgi:protein SCO1/2